MLSPKRTKYRKAHKGRIHGSSKGGTRLNFGSYGLKAVTPARVTARQIEAARRDPLVDEIMTAFSGAAISEVRQIGATHKDKTDPDDGAQE